MSKFLKTREMTQTKAFIHSFVKEIEVKPGKALMRYTVPMPDDSLILGRTAEKMALNGSAHCLPYKMVGHPGLEPGTSVLSGLRSNHLS